MVRVAATEIVMRCLFPEHPVSATGEVILSFTLRQRHGGWNSDDNQNYLLGRYQFSVTESDTVEESELPSLIEAILQIPESERTAEQNQSIVQLLAVNSFRVR